jgi:FkbM family methyltransferase
MQTAQPPLMAQMARSLLRSNLKGRHRLTAWLAQWLQPLQAVPIAIADWSPIYIDLRFISTHQWLMGHPWRSCPREEDEQAVMRQLVRRSDVVFDIGANLGLHTALLSQLVGAEGQVVAFEPNPELLTALSKTVSAMPNVSLYPCALSNTTEPTQLFVPPHNPDVGSLADWTKAEYGVTHQVTCDQQRLDTLVSSGVIPYPQFIKCDVEGAEPIVFEGAKEALDQPHAPIVLFESNQYTASGFSGDRWEAMKFLQSLPKAQYKMFEVKPGGKLSDRLGLDSLYASLLAIPASHSALR